MTIETNDAVSGDAAAEATVESTLAWDFFDSELPTKEPTLEAEEEGEGIGDEEGGEPGIGDGAALGADDVPPEDESDPEPATSEPPVAPATPSAEMQALQQQNQVLQMQLQQMQGMMMQLAQRTQAPAQEEPSAPASMTLPAEVVTLLDSEDPADRVKALQMAMDVTANTLWGRVQQEQQKLASAVPTAVQRHVQLATAQQQVSADFNSHHPDLSNPAFGPVLQQVGQELAQTMGAQGWTPQFRDALAAEVRRRLGMPAPVAETAPVVARRQAPKIMGKPNTRSNPRPATQASQGDQIVDILNLM